MKTPYKKVIMHGEHKLTVYSIGWLALLSSRHPQTVRNWEYDGILPKPIFTEIDEDGTRFYCVAELVGYVHILNAYPRPKGWRGKTDWKGLQDKLYAFRANLVSLLKQENPKALIAVLPSEARVMDQFTSKSQDRHFKALAKQLLK